MVKLRLREGNILPKLQSKWGSQEHRVRSDPRDADTKIELDR